MRLYTLIFAMLFVGVAAGCGNQAGPNTTDDEQLFAAAGDYAGSHILISYEGAMRAGEDVTRTKEEAYARAQELIDQLEVNPEQFEQLAESESDGPSGPRGGDLGAWPRGSMVPEFETALDEVGEGEIVPEPVETPFGYHVIRRNSLMVPHYGAEAFIVGFAGGPQTPPEVTRTQEEAQAIAEELRAQIENADFAELATEYNDFGEGAIFLGGFKSGDRAPLPGLVDTLQTLSVGQAVGPIELPVGYAFVRRVPLEQRSGAHILIAYEGAMRAGEDVTRTKEEAQARAAELAQELQADPDQFAAYAEQYSDGPSGPQGGDLGRWFRGEMVPEFDEALDEMDEGEITAEPVETPFGYHIIQRRAPDAI